MIGFWYIQLSTSYIIEFFQQEIAADIIEQINTFPCVIDELLLFHGVCLSHFL